jgi:hypothetical protein
MTITIINAGLEMGSEKLLPISEILCPALRIMI